MHPKVVLAALSKDIEKIHKQWVASGIPEKGVLNLGLNFSGLPIDQRRIII